MDPNWKLPAPMQIAYIVPDLEAALAHWTQKVGAGPFFVIDNVEFKEQWFRGQAVDVKTRMALGYWGDVQLEFVEQVNDAPSPYREFVASGLRGMHHLGVVSESLERDLGELEQRGLKRLYWGETTVGVRFAYVDSDFHPGGMIELIEASPTVLGLFGAVREAARNWDGSDPIRRVG